MNKLLLSTLLLWLIPLFLSSRVIEARTHSCSPRGTKEFRCIGTKFVGQIARCIDIEKVCDGHYDCEDGSDEWDYLCNHICSRYPFLDPWEKGFSCKINGTSFFNGTGLEKFNHEASHNGTINGNRNNSAHYRSRTVDHGSQAVKKEHQNDPIYDQKWLTDSPNYQNCLPIQYYCDFEKDCRTLAADGTAVDETKCECNENKKCLLMWKEKEPDYYWWARILATTFVFIVLFFFCICGAIQWEKRRVALQMRRREAQQRRLMEATSRRISPANGQLNMGISLDPTEFQARVNNEGGTAAAPPSYSHATQFHKPVDRDLPPPYLPEWISAYPAQTAPPGEGNIGPIPYFTTNAACMPRGFLSENAPAYSVAPASTNIQAVENSPGAIISPTVNGAAATHETAQMRDTVQMAASSPSVQ